MSSLEQGPNILLLNSPDYDYHLFQRGISFVDTCRAKGMQYKDGKREIVIDKQYYLEFGIPEELLQAIIEHQIVEMNDTTPDAHYNAVLAEYSYVVEQFGTDTLRTYHDQLTSLYEGVDTDRIRALEMILDATSS